MAGKRKAEKVNSTGINLGDLLAEHTAEESKPRPGKTAKDKLKVRVDILKARATAEKVPWPEALEKQLRACGTAGAVRRLWREHRIKHGV